MERSEFMPPHYEYGDTSHESETGTTDPSAESMWSGLTLDHFRGRYAQLMMLILTITTLTGCLSKTQQVKKDPQQKQRVVPQPRPQPRAAASAKPQESPQQKEKRERIERIKNLIVKFKELPRLPAAKRREFIKKTITESDLFLLGMIEQQYVVSPYLAQSDIDENHDLYKLEADREKWKKEFKAFATPIIEKIADAPTRFRKGSKQRTRGYIVSQYLRKVVVGSDTQLNWAAQYPTTKFTQAVLPYMLAALFYKKKFPNSYKDSPQSSFKDLLRKYSANGNSSREYQANEQRQSLCKYLAIMGSDLIHMAINLTQDSGLIAKKPQVGTMTSKTAQQSAPGISAFTGVGTPVEHVVIASPINGNGVPAFYFEATTGEIRPWSALIQGKEIKQNEKPRDIVGGMGGLITADYAAQVARPLLNGVNNTGVQEKVLLQKAMVYLKLAMNFDPNNHVIQTNTGVLLVTTGKNKQAIPHFQRALHLNPYDFAAPSLGNATAHFNIQKFPQTISILKTMIAKIKRKYPKKIPQGNNRAAYIKGHHLLTETQLITGKKRAAVRSSRKVLKMSAMNPYSQYLYGRSLVARSKRYCRRGIRHIKRGDGLSGEKDTTIRLGLGKAYERCGMYRKSKKVFESLGREDHTLRREARKYMKQKKWDAALRSWLNLAAIDSNEFAYIYYVAICFEKKGDYRKSIEYAKRALRLRNDPEARKILEFGYRKLATNLYNQAVAIYKKNRQAGTNPVALKEIHKLYGESAPLLTSARPHKRIQLLKKLWVTLLKDAKQAFNN